MVTFVRAQRAAGTRGCRYRGKAAATTSATSVNNMSSNASMLINSGKDLISIYVLFKSIDFKYRGVQHLKRL